MSLVNSFINQIGRELGRDAYRSVVSGVSRGRRQQQIINTEEPVYNQVLAEKIISNTEIEITEVNAPSALFLKM